MLQAIGVEGKQGEASGTQFSNFKALDNSGIASLARLLARFNSVRMRGELDSIALQDLP